MRAPDPLKVQMVQIGSLLQPENTGWWGYFINSKSAQKRTKRTRGALPRAH